MANEEEKDEQNIDGSQTNLPNLGGELFDGEPHGQKPKQVMMTDDELRQIKKESMEYKDKYLRLLADADNARKRLQKERQELIQYALENVMIDFLRPLDNFENALKFADQMSDEVKNWAFGFQMILTQFKDVLANNGVMPVQSQEGAQFDPHYHEAIEIIETNEYRPGTIVEECVRGYKMGDRTIRPARVKVAKEASQDKNNQQQESNKEAK